MPPKPKHRIGNLEGGFILVIAFLLWGLMVLLSFTGIGEIGSEFIALVGSGLFGGWFWIRGAYKGEAALKNLMTTLGGTVLDIIPFLNDAPIMIAEVAFVLISTRVEDIATAKENEKKAALAIGKQTQTQVKNEKARAAVQKANAMRQPALEKSKEIAGIA